MLFKFLTMSYSLSFARLAEEKKEEGNQLYKLKSYRDALAKYSEAIGRFFLHQIRIGTGHLLDSGPLDTKLYSSIITRILIALWNLEFAHLQLSFLWPCQQQRIKSGF